MLSTRPPRVKYSLTDLGSSLTVPLRSVAEWAQANRAQITANRREWDATI
ncbi:winged helix-turn-helix transcriptional regulator [Micropruina sp.]